MSTSTNNRNIGDISSIFSDILFPACPYMLIYFRAFISIKITLFLHMVHNLVQQIQCANRQITFHNNKIFLLDVQMLGNGIKIEAR